MSEQLDKFKKALEQSRKHEPLDLSEEEFGLYSAIQADGVLKAQGKKLDRPELREKIKELARQFYWWSRENPTKGKSINLESLTMQVAKDVEALIKPLIEEAVLKQSAFNQLNFDKERVVFWVRIKEAKKQNTEQIDAMLVEARRVAREQERERIWEKWDASVKPIVTAEIGTKGFEKEWVVKFWEMIRNKKEENIGKDKGKV